MKGATQPGNGRSGWRALLRWAALVAVLFAAVIVPFLVAGHRVETWVGTFLETARSRPVSCAGVLCGLLAFDIVLPVPSSIVSTAAGGILGFLPGAAVTFVGMSLSCILGFLLGWGPGTPFARRMVGPRELDRLERVNRRVGDWLVVVCRPVPVLAEASVVFVAMGRMGWGRFLFLSSLANAGIAAVYAAAGAWASTASAFLYAFAAAIALPGLAMLAVAGRRRAPR
jgi:uncharacterized membrane protein YdjX (TVP38/TMEM64 family)